MNYFTKKNLVIFSIAVLLIVNIAAIGTVIFLTYNKPPMLEPAPRTELMKNAERMLKLSPEQKNTFETLHKNYKEKTQSVFMEMHQKRVLMMDEFSKTEPDSMTLYDLAKQTGQLHEQLKRITIEHLLNLKGVCTDEQFRYLEGMFRQKIMEDEPTMHQPYDGKRKFRNRRPQSQSRER